MNLKGINSDYCMKDNNVLITGINGFIGDNLKQYIKSRYPSWYIYGIDKKGNGADSFNVDIRNKKKLKSILCRTKPKYIFHMAGDALSKNFKTLLFSNIYTTFILLKTIQEIEGYRPRVLIPSSASEYGEVPPSCIPIDENCQLNPISVYGFSKMVQTDLSLFFSRKGMDIVVARIFNILGEGTPVSSSIGKFAYELSLIKKKMRKPEIYTKKLDSKRDFMDIRDICKYLVAIAIHGKGGEVYNVCRGRAYKIRDLLTKLIRISGVNDVTVVEDKKSGRSIDIINSCGSARKLKKIVNMPRVIPIEQSLEDTFNYYYK